MDIIKFLQIKVVILDFLRRIAIHPESVLPFIVNEQSQDGRFIGLEVLFEFFGCKLFEITQKTADVRGCYDEMHMIQHKNIAI